MTKNAATAPALETPPAISSEERQRAAEKVGVSIKAPNLRVATFLIKAAEGVPLVVKRKSAKLKEQLRAKQEEGKSAGSKKNRSPQDIEATFNEARYFSKDGWDGFNASGIRAALISVCRLVDYKMTLAKMSIFVIADGQDAMEPQMPLVRIYGDAVRQEDLANVETGQPYVTIRAAYHNWHAKVRIRYDADQFTLADVTNLMHRVGLQNGLGEGRPNSKNSIGMGWGLFELEKTEEHKAA